MKQYLQLLKDIKEKGTHKSAARENMPGTISLFGYQIRHNLQDGFPLLTTKKIKFSNIVTELIWFLKGDTNVKFLVDNGFMQWNQDAYQYYNKFIYEYCEQSGGEPPLGIVHEDIEKSELRTFSFEEFEEILKNAPKDSLPKEGNYTLGDCGKQYGWLWRNWKGNANKVEEVDVEVYKVHFDEIDQFKNLVEGLLKSPESRRHIITAWNPATLDDMALPACHTLVQFNCRPIPWEIKLELAKRNPDVEMENLAITEAAAGDIRFGFVPQYYLDCSLYMRSADVFLGVPYNIACYALLTEILANITGVIPGDLVISFGDVHIYDNLIDSVDKQLSREPRELPKVLFRDTLNYRCDLIREDGVGALDKFIEHLELDEFKLEGYNPHAFIKGELSTGLK